MRHSQRRLQVMTTVKREQLGASMPRTKIVCTIGPASRSPEILEQLIRAGMAIARSNFSHGAPAEHLEVITAVRHIAARLGRPVANLQDLAGLKIRIGDIATGSVTLDAGAAFTLTTRRVPGTRHEVSVAYPDFTKDAQPGDTLLLGDGDLELEVLDTTADDVHCRVVTGGTLASRKGVNLPSRSITAMTWPSASATASTTWPCRSSGRPGTSSKRGPCSRIMEAPFRSSPRSRRATR
jgi:pyruvate kinase